MPKNRDRSWITVALLSVAMTVGGLVMTLVKGTTQGSKQRKDAMNQDVMFEARDVNASIIGWVAVGVIVSAFLIHALVKASYLYFSHTEFQGAQPVTLVHEAPRQPSLPALQVRPEDELGRLRETETQTLNTYGWVDQQKGTVRIPIDEAMKRVLANGLPPAEKAAPSPANEAAGTR